MFVLNPDLLQHVTGGEPSPLMLVYQLILTHLDADTFHLEKRWIFSFSGCGTFCTTPNVLIIFHEFHASNANRHK